MQTAQETTFVSMENHVSSSKWYELLAEQSKGGTERLQNFGVITSVIDFSFKHLSVVDRVTASYRGLHGVRGGLTRVD